MAAKNVKEQQSSGTGRRKSSVARVRIRPGAGKIQINQRDVKEYFPGFGGRELVAAPLVAVGCQKDVDVVVRVTGGGPSGQAGAVSLGVARALVRYNEDYEDVLRDKKFLTVDSRRKERKKYGRAGARRSFQFSKR